MATPGTTRYSAPLAQRAASCSTGEPGSTCSRLSVVGLDLLSVVGSGCREGSHADVAQVQQGVVTEVDHQYSGAGPDSDPYSLPDDLSCDRPRRSSRRAGETLQGPQPGPAADRPRQ